jgi:hypothetical protein
VAAPSTAASADELRSAVRPGDRLLNVAAGRQAVETQLGGCQLPSRRRLAFFFSGLRIMVWDGSLRSSLLLSDLRSTLIDRVAGGYMRPEMRLPRPAH